MTLADRIDHAVGQAWINHITGLAPDDPVVVGMARRLLTFTDPVRQSNKEEAQRALAAAQRRVRKLEEDFYVYGKMDEERFEELSEGQRTLIAGTTAALEALDAGADLAPLLQIEKLRETWEAADLAHRRELLRCALGDRGITVAPAARQGDHTPILERLEFDWIS
ncbi:hypothetical protein WB401_38095 [Streptomyces brasiliscabiei]|uniref:Uncharacterized protein n=1 Tax=Streptomyces brasiliscabiei TaxID=2736302 RepID=A0ABU8GU06_9ACTN